MSAPGRRPRGAQLSWRVVLIIGVSVAAAAALSVAVVTAPHRNRPPDQGRLDDQHPTAAAPRPDHHGAEHQTEEHLHGDRAGRLSPLVGLDLRRVYVPDGATNQITVIDPISGRVVDSFAAGHQPQHIVPSWDLRTLWVLDNSGNDVFPIDPRTGRPGPHVRVDDPYNLYFTPDGRSAIIVAEARRRLDFRDPHSMQLQSSLRVPGCAGINHADYSGDYRYMLVTCEFGGGVAKVDMVHRKVMGFLRLGASMNAAQSDSGTTMSAGSAMSGTSDPSMPTRHPGRT